MGDRCVPAAGAEPETAPEGRYDEALRALVAGVTGRGLRAPAAFVLEVVSPLRLLIQQAFYLSQPFLEPWLGQRALLWAELLEDPEALEQALRMLREA